MPRALFFSPYSMWHYHGVCEATLGHALRLRGYEVDFVACDGEFPVCDVFRESINPRTARSCLQCQRATADLFDGMATPYEWLGRYIDPRERDLVLDWLESFSRGEVTEKDLLEARYGDYPVGQWAYSSTAFQFRLSRLDLARDEVRSTFLKTLYGTALATHGVGTLLDYRRPDLVMLLNGRFFSHSVAFELARERGIRVVTHERGLRRDTIRFAENARIHGLEIYEELWASWRDVPLRREEFEFTREVLEDRRFGRKLPFMQYSPVPEDEAPLRRKLALDERPLVVLFSSSDDESAGFEDRREGAFPDPLEWLVKTVELAPSLPQFQWIVRMHPNLTKLGTNHQTLSVVGDLLQKLPENVRIVMPDDPVSSYTLADMSSLGLVYFSTLGLEMACRGQAVLTVARGWYGHCDFVRWVRSAKDYAAAVRETLDPKRSPDTARRAYRFAHQVYKQIARPFPWVIEEPQHQGRTTYSDLGALAPGRDPSLDRMCDQLAGREPLLLRPGDDPGVRDENEERRFFQAWLAEADEAGPRRES